MVGPIVCARFFDFFAYPKKVTPHPCGLPWANKVRTRTSVAVDPAVTARAKVERARPAPASAAGPPATLFIIRPPQGEGAHPSARHLIPAPRRAPVTFFTHLLQLVCPDLCASLRRRRCAVTLLFSRCLQKLRKKSHCQRDVPLVRASVNLQCSPVCS
jgi:hypothetical protein